MWNLMLQSLKYPRSIITEILGILSKMVKFVILLGLLVFTGIYGIPTSEPVEDDSSVSETPRIKEWITFNPSWSFSSLASISRLFKEKPDENSMLLMKRRIEILEKSQNAVIKLIKSLVEDGIKPCISNKSIDVEELSSPLKSEEINKETWPQVKSTSPSTFTASTTIDQLPIEVNATATVKDIQSEINAQASSEKSITDVFESVELELTTQSNNNASENSMKSSVAILLDKNENSRSSSGAEEIRGSEIINQTELPNPLELEVHSENSRMNNETMRDV